MTDTPLVTGNHFDKYGSRNPLVRWMMKGFFEAFDDLLAATGATEVYEVGCGEGKLSAHIMDRGIRIRGCDIGPEEVAMANGIAKERGVPPPFEVRDIYELADKTAIAPLVVCCEVLEHLPDARKALDVLERLTQKHLIVSVPREPLWRMLNLCRGAYLSACGNTPGHIQHWSSRAFRLMLDEKFEVLEMRRPLPWTMALCRRRDVARPVS
ncbi:class I SAM-dependent methyltransferase [Parvibaculum sp.]|uniref:class I SAM-dependent methyltransferase n=1 Tax=Parvibaculum sp. TaxID=2024848 RepID=UPI002CBDB7E8|nr:class I SAM-dependent methyltransferase [Parvibaculum sp.]HUD53365.1 class I SAM-dependent methyltransferase [Parvibaculum sp.]